MADPKKVTVVVDNGNPTKNTVRFVERDAKGETSKAVLNGAIYVHNDAMATLGNPEKVKVTLEAA